MTTARTHKAWPDGRIEYIDVLRVVACYLVVMTHSVRPATHMEYGPWMCLISFCCSAAPVLFLSLSGTLLLPLRMSTRQFYKRRFLKLLPPVVFWSVVITVIYWLLGLRTTAEALENILLLPLLPITGIYWFIYVLIGLYLFAPFINAWLKQASRHHLEFFLLIWAVNGVLPYLNLIFPGKFDSHGNYLWELHYFGGFLGYWLIGYYLHRYPIRLGLNAKFILLTLSIIVYTALIAYFELYTDISGQSIFIDYLQVGSALIIAMAYTIAQNLHIRPRWLQTAIVDVAQCSFGIYLIHIVIVRNVVWPLLGGVDMHPLPDALLITTASFAVSYIIVKAISKLPFSRYLIGI